MPGEQKNKKNWLAENILGFGSHLRFAAVWHLQPIIIYRKVQIMNNKSIINYDLHQIIIFLWKKKSQAYQVSNIFRRARKTKAEKQAQ